MNDLNFDTPIAPIGGRLTKSIHLSQYDVGRVVNIHILDQGEDYMIPDDAVCTLIARKADGNIFTSELTHTSSYAQIVTEEQLTAVCGEVICEVRIAVDDADIGTANFVLSIEKSPQEGAVESESVISQLQTMLDAATTASQAATNAAVSAAAAAVSASEAETSASDAASSAEAAATSETNAGISETNAADSASAAASSAEEAETSASEAAASADSAADSATSAAAYASASAQSASEAASSAESAADSASEAASSAQTASEKADAIEAALTALNETIDGLVDLEEVAF